MGMKIDEAEEILKDVELNYNYIQNRESRTGMACKLAIDIIQKYQKIKEIVSNNELEWGNASVRANALFEVKKVVEDGNDTTNTGSICGYENCPTVEAIPKANVYKAIQEMMKYEHEGFINISLARLDEILKKCGVSEDDRN